MKYHKLLGLTPIIGGKATHLKTELLYSEGSLNIIAGENEPSGLYLSVTPVNHTVNEKGRVSEKPTLFTGAKKHIKNMPFFNKKIFNSFVVDKSVLKDVINKVVDKNNFVLKNLDMSK